MLKKSYITDPMKVVAKWLQDIKYIILIPNKIPLIVEEEKITLGELEISENQFEIIRILVIVIGLCVLGFNSYQEGFRRLLKWDAIFLMILMILMFVPLSLVVG
jgi:hypothetical protein